MSFKTTGILIIILALLGTYYYFFEVVEHEKEEAREEIEEKVFQFETDSIDVFTLKNQYGEFEFQKIQGEWRITKPVYTQAEENVVTSALNNLTGAKKDKVFTIRPDQKKEYGIGDHSIRVWFKLKDGSSDSLNLGDQTPVGSSVFVSNLDTIVYTIPQNIKTSLNKKLFDWRFKNLLQFERNDVQRMVIERSSLKYEFEKTGTSDWNFLTINRPANLSMMNSILNKLTSNRAKEFVDEEGTKLNEYGLSNPRYRIDLFLGEDQGKKSIIISRKINNKYYAKDDSRKPIFEIDSALVGDIKKPRNDFRDKKLAKIKQNEIDHIGIEYDNTMLVCVKDSADDWRLVESDNPFVKKSEINSFFSSINNSNISEFVADNQYSLATFGLQNPALKIQLFSSGSEILEIKFGKFKDDKVYAMTDQYNSVYLLPKSQFNKLKLKRSQILEKPVSLNDSTMVPNNK